jgi:hypothetical protein
MSRPLPSIRQEFFGSSSDTRLNENIVAHLTAQARAAVLLITVGAHEDAVPLGASAAKQQLKGAKDWRLLLQVGADENAGMTRPGAYYVVLREHDIAARRFDEARVVYQCD